LAAERVGQEMGFSVSPAARFRQGDSTLMTTNMNSVFSRLQSSLKASTDAVSRLLLKSSGWAATGQLLSAAVSFGETIVLARYFSVTDFGAFVTMTAVADLINSLLEFRSGIYSYQDGQ
jgi:hypothetical protein